MAEDMTDPRGSVYVPRSIRLRTMYPADIQTITFWNCSYEFALSLKAAQALYDANWIASVGQEYIVYDYKAWDDEWRRAIEAAFPVESTKQYAEEQMPVLEEKTPVCDCGAEKARTTHSSWCSLEKK